MDRRKLQAVAGRWHCKPGQHPTESPDRAWSEDLLEIPCSTQIVRVPVALTFPACLDAVCYVDLKLDGGLVGQHQEDVEASKDAQGQEDRATDEEGRNDALPGHLCIATRHQRDLKAHPTRRQDQNHKRACGSEEQEEEAEESVILEPDTVVDPRAMVVHLQDTPIADGAMVAPLRLQAMATAALLRDGLVPRLGAKLKVRGVELRRTPRV
mmetsp:Transcript_58522/g.131636  ORF Transcript_58522/g.131636 Transcript_58522/m.131636 type:complete len:211 (+) Transcript_58522:111-743(+)